MGFDTDLLTGIAQYLDTAGIATYSTTTAYTSDQIGITFQKLPPSPDGAINLQLYPVTDDVVLSDSVIGLQVQMRAAGLDPRPTGDLAAAVFDQLQGLAGVTLASGVQIVIVERHGGAWLGQDDLNRWIRSDNYYLTVWRPSTHRY